MARAETVQRTYYLPFTVADRSLVALCVAICKADAARLGMGDDAERLDELWLRLQPDSEETAA